MVKRYGSTRGAKSGNGASSSRSNSANGSSAAAASAQGYVSRLVQPRGPVDVFLNNLDRKRGENRIPVADRPRVAQGISDSLKSSLGSDIKITRKPDSGGRFVVNADNKKLTPVLKSMGWEQPRKSADGRGF